MDGLDEAATPYWIIVMCACGVILGLATMGYKIMMTLGARMCAMSSTRGYCIELASALTVVLFSYFGLPTSTTHATVGSTVGVGFCEYWRKVLFRVYLTPPRIL